MKIRFIVINSRNAFSKCKKYNIFPAFFAFFFWKKYRFSLFYVQIGSVSCWVISFLFFLMNNFLVDFFLLLFFTIFPLEVTLNLNLRWLLSLFLKFFCSNFGFRSWLWITFWSVNKMLQKKFSQIFFFHWFFLIKKILRISNQ